MSFQLFICLYIYTYACRHTARYRYIFKDIYIDL